ncbi:MAG: Alanine--tRNA ligase [Candidatus Heimdallarchaeota archaeon LC_2]|nr:MAG: Alanine--tRNA ligase [Candidatus Heimdallarchaeota archaeon LC_2]
MGHHHEEYDIPEEILPKLKNYWKEPFKFNFNTSIKEVDSDWVQLNENYFYPESGGQLPDRGIITPLEDRKIKYNVLDVQKKENEVWILIPDNQLNQGDKIEARIDEERRISLSRNHSAQHLISAVFWEELDFDTTRAEIGQIESQIELNKPPTLDQIDKANKMVNKLILENLIIESRYYSDLNNLNHKYRGKMEDLEVYQLVAIGDYDLNPCGGTHVQSTREIDTIFINKIESKKIRFYSGPKAKSAYVDNAIGLIKLSRMTSVPFDKIPSSVDEIIRKKNYFEKKVLKLENEVLELKYSSTKFQKLNKFKLKSIQASKLNKSTILGLTDDLNKNEVVFAFDDNDLFILSSGNEELTKKIMKVLRESGVKGGGKGKSVMGKIISLDVEKLKSIISDRLKSM